jgi:hypothetical protein
MCSRWKVCERGVSRKITDDCKIFWIEEFEVGDRRRCIAPYGGCVSEYRADQHKVCQYCQCDHSDAGYRARYTGFVICNVIAYCGDRGRVAK